MFTHDDILATLAGDLRRVSGRPVGPYPGAMVDSRRIRPGDLFVAFPGEHVDGNDFVDDAFAHGAAGALVERMPGDVPEGKAVYEVEDALVSLQTLAKTFWRQRPMPALSITGTVGKTSTKEVAARLFGRRYHVLMTEGGLNGDAGLPLVLLRREPEHDFAVLELGMHYQGEISLQCNLAPPTYGIVTNVGYTHMMRVGSLAAIAEAKRELVEHIPPDGAVALNGDDPIVMQMREAAFTRVLVYGLSEGCDVHGGNVESYGRDGISLDLSFRGSTVRVRTPLVGRHNAYTCLSTAAIALADGFSLEEIAGGLAEVENPLRLAFLDGPNGSVLIDDTYNASPASMAAALQVLAEQPGRRIAALGDMLELGDAEEGLHRTLGADVAGVADVFVAVGTRSRWTAEAARAAGARDVREFPSKDGLADALRAELRSGDVLLLKGSRGLALETVVAELGARSPYVS
jgi:UDP-N-acetylmuramoyl-tripeptide--D-alanyl-D-alanine ligase